MSEFLTLSQKFRLARDTLPRMKPWWCTCDSGEDSKGAHKPECMGNQPAFPRLTAALSGEKT